MALWAFHSQVSGPGSSLSLPPELVLRLTSNAERYTLHIVIKSFRCEETERLFNRHRSKRFQNVERVALRKLTMLHAATELQDLASPPGNRFEALHGDRRGQYSIRVNDQWRICFVWRDGDAYDVEITDYH